MDHENPVNQTHLALAALAASIVKTLDAPPESNRRFVFEQALAACYRNLEEAEVAHIEAMETLRWTKEFLRML